MKAAGTWRHKASNISYAAFVVADDGEEWKGELGCVITVPLRWEPEGQMTFSGIWRQADFNSQFILLKK